MTMITGLRHTVSRQCDVGSVQMFCVLIPFVCFIAMNTNSCAVDLAALWPLAILFTQKQAKNIMILPFASGSRRALRTTRNFEN